MTAKQISVFLENKPGQLSEFTKLLNENNINMCAPVSYTHLTKTKSVCFSLTIISKTVIIK